MDSGKSHGRGSSNVARWKFMAMALRRTCIRWRIPSPSSRVVITEPRSGIHHGVSVNHWRWEGFDTRVCLRRECEKLGQYEHANGEWNNFLVLKRWLPSIPRMTKIQPCRHWANLCSGLWNQLVQKRYSSAEYCLSASWSIWTRVAVSLKRMV